MRAIAAIILVAAALGALTLPLSAQDDSLRVNVRSAADDTYPVARLVVNVEDSSAAGETLGISNFSVRANGSEARVVTAEVADSKDAPLDVVMVIDTSGSMEGAALAATKEAAKAFLDSLAPDDRVALIHFGDQVVAPLDFTDDRAATVAAIDALVARGNTALYQATTVGALKAATSTAARRAVILLSDGADFGGRSVATRAESLGAAAAGAVPVFAIAQGTDLDRPYLQELANVTRGRYLEAPRPEDLHALYASIGRLLRSQYVVTFDASSVAHLAQSEVALTVTSGERSVTDTVTYRPAPGFVPVLSLSGVLPGETFEGSREFLVNVGGTAAVAKVTWYVDNVNVQETTEVPHVFQYDAAKFGPGEHTVKAVADLNGAPVEAIVPFEVTVPPASGGGFPVLWIAAIVLVLALVGGAVYFVRKRLAESMHVRISADQRVTPWAVQVANQKRATLKELAGDVSETDEASRTEGMSEVVGDPLGLLISRSGPDVGSEYSVGSTPVSIGTAATCGVRVKDPSLNMEEARIWVRGAQLMVHRITRLTSLDDAAWSIMESGETFQIHGHSFEFRLIEPESAEASPEDADVPNILRDPDAPPRLTDLMPRNDGRVTDLDIPA